MPLRVGDIGACSKESIIAVKNALSKKFTDRHSDSRL